MEVNNKKKRFTIRVTLITTFIFACAFTAIAAISLHYYFSSSLAKNAAATQFELIATQVASQARRQEQAAVSLANVIKLQNIRGARSISGEQLARFSALLSAQEEVFSLFYGFSNGDYFEISNLESTPGIRRVWGAAPNDRWVVVQIYGQGGDRKKYTQFLDSKLNVRIQTEEPTDYDARQRPWFKSASQQSVNKMPPYMFSFIGRPGTSYAITGKNNVVAGTTVLLSSLSRYMDIPDYTLTGNGYLFDDNGEVSIEQRVDAPSELNVTPITLDDRQRAYLDKVGTLRVGVMDDYPPFEYSVSGQPRGYSVEHIRLLARKLGVELQFINGYRFPELVEQLKSGKIDMLLGLMKNEEREQFCVFANGHYDTRIIATMRQGEAQGQQRLSDFKELRIAAQKGYAVTKFLKARMGNANFIEYNDTLDALKGLNRGEVDVVFDDEVVINYIQAYFYIEGLEKVTQISELKSQSDFNFHHTVRKDLVPLMTFINRAINELKPSLKVDLKQKWLDFDSPRRRAELSQLPSKQLLDIAQQAPLRDRMHEIEIGNKTHYAYISRVEGLIGSGNQEYIALIVSEDEALSQLQWQVKKAMLITLLVLFIVLIIISQMARNLANPIQRLIEENQKIGQRDYDHVHYVDSHIEEIHQLSSAMVNMSESICDFEAGQKELLDAFIQLIAQAIDEKSPYTGGHCARVPELAMMLAQEANNQQKGPFAHFGFNSKEQWREFEVAAWLHDCGKITTPEHIVDKGSKLECIYNRIHEIRMRFEVLYRDARIDYLEAVNREPEEQLRFYATLQQRQKELKEDFAFVAKCNVGGEMMSEQDRSRLESIAEQTWYRNFDDCLGLSPAEQRRMKDFEHTTEGEEYLLADKKRHIFARNETEFSRNSGFGFNMEPTENKQNLGELYNLKIGRGTLTNEDRYIINEHIITTIRMLETLPLPEDLQRVPEYAGGHHEKLDGGGYPRGLIAEQMSVPARIMAIADIFEALTANDRPYKEAKTLSQSLKIMKFMAQDRHIDKDLFALFLTSGTYMDYARHHLNDSQIDDVDIKDYIIG
ncbi:phosphohydrolase [Pseudoalteromonas ruthenica]|uniref:HD domain-containing phosphohydrolase n=1 Tax=Pseudoalteromonas ruthenica TaxID=151081 RepID=UPI0011080767|nr:HD domain-containing phosphohydrolase [Pseudoalteromonas ruthenica]TLX51798.1 phosphohydrolase [Pseudoalteromonas ruthenica]